MDFESTCRVCLAVDPNFYNIFSQTAEASKVVYRDIIKEIAQLDHNEVDLVSKNICSSCRDFCLEFVKFRELILNSNEYQLMVLQNDNKLEMESVVIEEIVSDDLQFIEEVEKPHPNEPFELSIEMNDLHESENNEQFILTDDRVDDSLDFVTVASEDSEEELVDNSGKSSCEKCGKGFEKKSKLLQHLKTHLKKIRMYRCKICKRKFKTEVLLTRHESVHTPFRTENNQSCMISSSSYKSELLENFKQEHIEKEAMKCQHCDKTYDKLSKLLKHLKTHDGNNMHTCQICNKSYMQMSKLKVHMRIHSDDKEFLCTKCGRSFNRNSNLRQHLLRHTGLKRFKCNQCPSRFVSNGNLKAHMATHNSQKPYSCSICGSSFTQSYSLVKHHRIHSGDRPYQCEFCEMRFYSSDHLKRHLRTHTGEKPYKCEFCSKSFAQNGDLNKHKRLHVGENTYKCTEAGCDNSYRLQSELRDHMKVHFLKKENLP